MDRLIVRCLPAGVRARYAEEIQDLLEHSSRPVRDRVDLFVAAVGLRLGSRLRSLLIVAAVCSGGALAGLVHSLASLGEGATELFDHWWSAFAVATFMGSLFSTVLLAVAQHRARAWSTPT